MAEVSAGAGARSGAPSTVLLAVAVALLLALLTSADRGSESAGRGPAGSSYATAPDGAKGAYLLLERLGHRPQRRAEPLTDLRRVKLAFLLAPKSRLGAANLVGLAEWIEAGGTLVYGVAPFEPDAELLRQALELPALEIRPQDETEVPLLGDFAPARKLALRLRVDTREPAGDRTAVLARGQGRDWALLVKHGKGHIYLLDAEVFSNRGLKAGDNALFLATLAARHAGDGTILFDEFVHGYGDAVSLLSVSAWPLRVAVATGLFALLLYGLGAGRRLGPPSPEPAPPSRASIEQIEALASFYAARNARGGALAALAAWVGTSPPDPPGESGWNDAAFVVAARALLDRAITSKRNEGNRWQ